MLADSKEINHLMVVADMKAYGTEVKKICQQTDDKQITLFTMEPTEGDGFRQEILGFSLMAALGINADELK